ncbi:DoxX family protein [Aeromicrobium sp. CTD01-1L150]|uniref:DoxX family protein n=1 Tax=Aeromicrobium sp. CTD01-1L150 TaxID=3341830 RepID=UPI0035BF1A1C
MPTVLHALTTRPRAASDAGLLLGRTVIGLVFLAHGLQKVRAGIGATGEGFEQMGIPAPTVSAVFQATLEVAGGALLVAGALTSIVGVLLAASMVGAAFLVHSDAFYAAEGGWELVGVLAATSLLLALTGPGRFSVDAMLARTGQSAQKPPATDG